MNNSTTLFVFFLFSCTLFAQKNDREHNLTVAFEASLHLNNDQVLSELSDQIPGFSDLLVQHNFQLKNSLAFSDEDLDRMEKEAMRVSGTSVAIQNLRNIFDVILPEATDQEIYVLKAAFEKLPKLKYTELVSAKPIKPPFDIPPTTPNYQAQQTYLNPNPGVNMLYAWNMGLNGQGIKIINIEYGFNKNHEEFHQNPNVFIAPGYTVHPNLGTNFTEHGTGTLGVVVGDNGGYGVTGMAYGAEEVVLFPEYTQEYGYNRNYATSLALASATAGNIVMYEMQTGGANETSEDPKYVPAEYAQTMWNLTKAASDLGIIVVAAAGNGNQNLDAPEYSEYMSRGNSGAIIVGAGSPTSTHYKLYFSTYGARVNLQGWGSGVLSSGYGDYAKIGGDFNQQYTEFSGTSSATPIVASCVAVLQSYYHSLTGQYLNSQAMIDIFQSTGIPQSGSGNIGPLPNMQAAIAYVQNLSRNDFADKPSFNVYPNPFDNELNIIGLDNQADVNIEMYNSLGQRVLNDRFSVQKTILIGNLQSGVYFLKIKTGEKTVTHKVIKR